MLCITGFIYFSILHLQVGYHKVNDFGEPCVSGNLSALTVEMAAI